MEFWLSLAAPVLCAAAWILVPGLMVVGPWLRRSRVPLVWLLVPAVSVALIALAAVLAPVVGVSWGPLPVVVLALAYAAVSWGVAAVSAWPRRLREHSVDGAELPVALAAVALAAALMSRHFRNILESPLAFSQSWDNVFHLNAARQAVESANASSLDLLHLVTGTAPGSFYPAAWHGIVSLVMLSGATDSVVIATNAVIWATLALIAPCSMLALVHAALPRDLRALALLPAAVLLASVPAFPFLFMDWGVIYPNFLGYSLAPAVVTVAIYAARERTFVLVILGVLVSAGVALAHPTGALAVLLFSALYAWASLLVPRSRRGGHRADDGDRYAADPSAEPQPSHPTYAAARDGSPATPANEVPPRPFALLAALALTALTALAWKFLRPAGTSADLWDPPGSLRDSALAGTLHTAWDGAPVWITLAALALGAVATLARRDLFTLLAWASAFALWLAAAGLPRGELRTSLVGIWYGDFHRAFGFLGLSLIPLGAYGFGWTLRLLSAGVGRRQPWAPVALSLAAAVGLTFLTQAAPAMNAEIDRMSSAYQSTPEAPVLSPAEQDLMRQLPAHLGPRDVVYADPYRGEALTFAMTGIETSAKFLGRHQDSASEYLSQHLNQIGTDSRVCRIIAMRGYTHVLHFNPPEAFRPDMEAPGLLYLEKVPGIEPVVTNSGGGLYRITACGAR